MTSGGARRFAPPSVSSPPLEMSCMTSGNFVSREHSLGINAFHLEWCPKYRFKVLKGSILIPLLKESIMKTAKEYGMQIFAMEISLDHVHIFVNMPPTMPVSQALQLFKCRSSREIFKVCPSFRGTYYKGHFWSRGSFYRSVSNVSSSTIHKYITEHKAKELANTVEAVGKEFEQMSLMPFL